MTMKIEIKENTRESSSSFKYYVTKNNKVVRAHMTLTEAENFKKRLDEYYKTLLD